MSHGRHYEHGHLMQLGNAAPWQQFSRSGYSSTSPPGTTSTTSSPNSQCYDMSREELNIESLLKSLLQVVGPEDLASNGYEPRMQSPNTYPENRCRDCTDVLCEACTNAAVGYNEQLSEQQVMQALNSGVPSPPLMHPRHNSISPVMRNASPLYCDQHRDSLRFYCQTCSKPFCADCALHLHVGHVTENLADAVEAASLQAVQAMNEARHGVATLRDDLDSVHMSAEILEKKARDASVDVIMCVRRVMSALEIRQKELLNRIQKVKLAKFAILKARDEGFRTSLSRVTHAINRLGEAMESPTLPTNPLSLLVAKDNASAEVFQIRQTRQFLPQPEENWISFTGGEGSVLHTVANLGSVVTNNPGPIGDRRSLRGRGSNGGSPQFFRNTSPIQPPLSPQMIIPRDPVPRGRPVSASSFPVTIRTGRCGKITHPVKVIGNDRDQRDNLCRPWGVACDREGNVVIADRSNNRIQIYRQDGSFVRQFGSNGSGPGQFDRPAGIAVDARRRIIVADKDNHRIQVLTMEGIYLLSFGDKGCQNGQFNYPWDVAVNSECQIVVSDTRNHRVQLFSPEGIFLRKYGYESTPNMWKHFDSPRGLAFSPEGNVLVTDFNNHRIVVIDADFMNARILNCEIPPNGKQFVRPQGLVIDDEGNIVVADSRNHRIEIFDSVGNYKWKFGTQGKGPNEMDRPSGIALTPDGRILIVDFGNNRVLLV